MSGTEGNASMGQGTAKGWNPVNRLTIVPKLMVLIVLAGLIPLAIVGVLGYTRAANAIETEAEQKLVAVVALKQTSVEAWFSERVLDLQLLATLSVTDQAMADYGWAFQFGVESPQYKSAQRRWDGLLTAQKSENEVYDLFLIDLDGNVVYSVTHEADFATNMVSGAYASSGLATASKAGLAGQFVITDIESYAPSNGIPASFIGQQLSDESGNVTGALVLQLPLDQINRIMQERTGLGESGETYLVGQDHLMRSDSRFSDESTILVSTVKHAPVLRALDGESGSMTSLDYRGISVRSIYAPFEFEGLHWAILSEINESEINAPVVVLRNMVLLTAVATALALSAAAYLLAQTFSRPISSVRDALIAVSMGDLTQDVPADAIDEIGDMARAYGDMQNYLRDAADAADQIAVGDLRLSVTPKSERDELGNAFVGMQSYLRSTAIAATAIADGDPTVVVQPQSERDVFGNAFADMVRRMRAALLQAEASELRFRSLVWSASDAVIVLDDASRVTYVSSSIGRVWGHAESDLMDDSIQRHLHPDDASKFTLALLTVPDTFEDTLTVSFRVIAADASIRYIEATITDLRANSAVAGVVLNARDVTHRMRLEEDLRHAAFRDPLTGLPNRALFTGHQEETWPGQSDRGTVMGLLLVDIDNFKLVNDTRGHAAGDAALVAVAQKLRKLVPAGSFVGRLGGDEFGVLVRTDDREFPARIAGEITTAFAGAGKLLPSVSIGVSVSGSDLDTPAQLARAADIALYQAKHNGRGTHAVFDADDDESWRERLELELELTEAVLQDELRLRYQPVVRMGDSQLVAVEALVRWRHPIRGLLSPAVFIPIAEKGGRVAEIGSWVLVEAARQLAAWDERTREAGVAPLRYISVNVSPAELRDPGYARRVDRVLREAGVVPERIQLELTETVLLEDAHNVVERLHELKALGVRLAIDDFGTGYSSLSYLARLPIDVLKVDRSFVAEMLTSDRVESIVRAVLTLAETLGFDIIAEGVETEEQADRLAELGCITAQGYLFGVPLHAEALESLLCSNSDAGDSPRDAAA